MSLDEISVAADLATAVCVWAVLAVAKRRGDGRMVRRWAPIFAIFLGATVRGGLTALLFEGSNPWIAVLRGLVAGMGAVYGNELRKSVGRRTLPEVIAETVVEEEAPTKREDEERR